MKTPSSFPWDHYSDQPQIIRNKKLKRQIYLKASGQMLKSSLLLLLLPIFVIILYFKKSWKKTKVDRNIGLSVHVETECEGKTIVPLNQVVEMVEDIGVNQLLVRIPLSDFKHFDSYIKHIDALASEQREITVNILQSRELLDDTDLLKKALNELIPLLKNRVEYIHVGNAYNRRKWAFYHFGEYQKFFQIIRSICQKVAPEMKLIGGSVIDFELPPFLESLFHFRPGTYDGYASQLYVDRRGSPENTQLGFNFLDKINLVEFMRQSSWKAKGQLWISEINWPLQKSGKFSPCKGSVLVDEITQANYLTRAYLLAIASGKVRTCYWHQLVAPGYGLVDNRDNKVEKRPSYYAFKTLNHLLNDATVLHFDNGKYQGISGLFRLKCETRVDNKPAIVHILWSNNEEHEISFKTVDQWLDQHGKTITPLVDSKVMINASVKYALEYTL